MLRLVSSAVKPYSCTLLKCTYFKFKSILRSSHEGSCGENARRSKVVIVGPGAVGMFYGSRLLLAESSGNDLEVHFILRSDFERVSKYGVDIHCDDGRVQRIRAQQYKSQRFHADCISIPIENSSDGVDWVVCCLKSHSLMGTAAGETDNHGYNSRIKDMISPMIGRKTKILVSYHEVTLIFEK